MTFGMGKVYSVLKGTYNMTMISFTPDSPRVRYAYPALLYA